MRLTEGTVNGRAPLNGADHIKVADTLESRIVADQGGTRALDDREARSRHDGKPRPRWGRRLVIGAVVASMIGAGAHWGIPFIRYELNTVSTDDAFVSGHITNVSPRIEDVVTEVLVDQNDRVEPGTLLVRLDPEPFEVAVAQAQASLDVARANVAQARAQVRSQIAQARGAYYQRKNAQETLRRQVATLSAQFATLKSRQASLQLARNNLRRGQELAPSGGVSKEELDQRDNTLKVAIEQEKEAWAAIQETRATLGLEPGLQGPIEDPQGAGSRAVDGPDGRLQHLFDPGSGGHSVRPE